MKEKIRYDVCQRITIIFLTAYSKKRSISEKESFFTAIPACLSSTTKRRDCNHVFSLKLDVPDLQRKDVIAVFSLKLNVQAQTHLFSYSTGYEEHPQLRGGAKN